MRSKLVLAVLLLLTGIPAFSQVAPAAKVSGIPLAVGGGIMDFSMDYGAGRRIMGISTWADYRVFHGLSVEVEASDLFFARSSAVPRWAQRSIKGGLLYHTPQYHGIHPYVKGLFGITQADFKVRDPFYTVDDFTTYAVGAGLEYKVWKSVFLRADYEYQYVTSYLSNNSLNPNGVTIGATYYFQTRRFRHN
jgi:opacity protein-like surface antigen